VHLDARRAPTLKPERSPRPSRAQARVWARHQVEPTGRHNLAAAVRLRGALDVSRLLRGVEQLTRRHELLRTRFPLLDDQPHPCVDRTAAHELLVIDARDLDEEQRARRTVAALRQPFELEVGPLWRTVLMRVQAEEWRLSLAIHPILADRRSLLLLLRDLVGLCGDSEPGGGEAIGDAAREPDLCLRALAYWQDQLAGWTPLSLAAEGAGRSPSRGNRHALTVSDELRDSLEALGHRHGLPLDAILLGGFQILLARTTGQSDIAVAAQTAIGPLSTLLPIRAELAGSGLECLRVVAERLSAARLHACPYEDLADAMGLPTCPPISFAFEERPVLPALPDLEAELVEVDLAAAPVELSLHVYRDGGRLSAAFEYDREALASSAVARMGDRFLRLVRALADQPDKPIALLPLVGAEERDELLAWGRGPSDAATAVEPIHALLEAQVDRTPDAIAVTWDGGALSFRQLDGKANQLARYLVACGVRRDTPVCVHVDRSPEMVVALWGILKAGGTYVPLDAAYPPERLAHVLQHTQAAILLTQAALLPGVPAANLRAICLDTDWPLVAEESEERLNLAVDPDQLAYVIFTSGSTGSPKGVMIEHRSLVHYTRAAAAAYRIAPGDRVLQFASISFDASVEEIVPTLTHGATLALRGSPTLETATHFLSRCAEQHITVLSLPTAYWHEVVAALARGESRLPDCLRVLIIGGEQASARALADWKRSVGSRVQLLNTYGPTEATVVTTVWDAASATGDLASVPIGRPLAGSSAYVLDALLEPLPVGVPGELYIGGPAVARGYLGEEALTAERFVRDPFSRDPSARLYRTGDRCRLREDGELEFLGRRDHQLKLHGHRIELEEIEAHLRAHPGVVDAAVIARTDAQRETRLVAYVAGELASLSANQLRRHLERWLVPHLIPTLTVLERLPRTVSGKLDRRALPDPDERTATGTAGEAARNPVEELVQLLFSEALDGKSVGVHDDFFALGGDSLSALELIALVEARLEVEMSVQVLYDHPTVASLTEALLSAVHGDSEVSSDDLATDARLDGGIRVVATSAPAVSQPDTALLTGATGFFGAFVLAELLAQTSATIHCLVRARSIGEAHSRLYASWGRYFPTSELPADRVVAIAGDVSEPRLGLTDAAFHQLAERADVIYHSAAAVSYLLPYRSLRAANVHGTEEMIRLAATGRSKPLHHVSSLGVFGADGYSRSKWVAEKLCEQAQAIGMPLAIYRPGRLTGHSLSGESNADDFLLCLLQACVQLGAAPELDLEVDMVPVDFAASALVRLSLWPDRDRQVFHLGHPRPISWRQLVAALTSFGYRLRLVPFDSWIAAVKQLAAHRGSRLRLVSRFGRDQLTQALAAGYDCSSTLSGLAAAGGSMPPAIDERLLDAGFQYLVRAGLLPRPAGGT
jgi:amino acid adenylation domain-containing protein/thioester reductase-like protein